MLMLPAFALLVAVSVAVPRGTRPLTFEVSVASVDAETGAIPMPKSTSQVFLEIGCSDTNTLDEDILDREPSAFLLSFEPMLDKWAVLAGRGTTRMHAMKKDLTVPLGHHHPRGVVLPVAVSDSRGTSVMHISSIAGCSSLQEFAKGIPSKCTTEVETRHVPTITLSDALALVPQPLPVRLLKLDAQGKDLQILQSTPAAELARIQQLTFEVVRDCPGSSTLYQRDSCEETLQRMRSLGFQMQGYLVKTLQPPTPTPRSQVLKRKEWKTVKGQRVGNGFEVFAYWEPTDRCPTATSFHGTVHACKCTVHGAGCEDQIVLTNANTTLFPALRFEDLYPVM